MERSDRSALLASPAAIIAALLVAWAGGQGGTTWMGVPTFVLMVAIAFLLQWLAFIPAYFLQTEKFFDITGSASYVIVAGLALALGPAQDARSVLLFTLVVIWATRLGIFLLRRVHRSGRDARFDDIKPSIPRFLMTWTLQGLWISLTLAAVLAAMTTPVRSPLGAVSYIGLGVWILGIAIEALADMQKSRFHSDSANKGTFIRTGLWSWSRHPNYFGEILLWVGVAVIASPVLRGWQWITLISPLFVMLLLTRVSGIPMLEKRADKKWGGQDSYELYKRRTSVLVLWPPKKSRG